MCTLNHFVEGGQVVNTTGQHEIKTTISKLCRGRLALIFGPLPRQFCPAEADLSNGASASPSFSFPSPPTPSPSLDTDWPAGALTARSNAEFSFETISAVASPSCCGSGGVSRTTAVVGDGVETDASASVSAASACGEETAGGAAEGVAHAEAEGVADGAAGGVAATAGAAARGVAAAGGTAAAEEGFHCTAGAGCGADSASRNGGTLYPPSQCSADTEGRPPVSVQGVRVRARVSVRAGGNGEGIGKSDSEGTGQGKVKIVRVGVRVRVSARVQGGLG